MAYLGTETRNGRKYNVFWHDSLNKVVYQLIG